jgi:hypothetical protein
VTSHSKYKNIVGIYNFILFFHVSFAFQPVSVDYIYLLSDFT